MQITGIAVYNLYPEVKDDYDKEFDRMRAETMKTSRDRDLEELETVSRDVDELKKKLLAAKEEASSFKGQLTFSNSILLQSPNPLLLELQFVVVPFNHNFRHFISYPTITKFRVLKQVGENVLKTT